MDENRKIQGRNAPFFLNYPILSIIVRGLSHRDAQSLPWFLFGLLASVFILEPLAK